MKARLNLTIEENLLAQIKEYASEKQVSISELVEEYFARLARPKKNNGAVDFMEFVDKLPKVELPYPDDVDLKKQYYEEKAAKYGL